MWGGGTFSDLFASVYSAVWFYDLFTPSYIMATVLEDSFIYFSPHRNLCSVYLLRSIRRDLKCVIR